MDDYDLHNLDAASTMSDSTWPGCLRALVPFDPTHNPATQEARYDPRNVLLDTGFNFRIRLEGVLEPEYSRQKSGNGIFIKTLIPAVPDQWPLLLVHTCVGVYFHSMRWRGRKTPGSNFVIAVLPSMPLVHGFPPASFPPEH